MSRANGQLVTCERCGKTTFRKDTNLGFFEKLPEGWINPPTIGDLCPDCSLEWERLEEEFENKKKEFMEAIKCNT